MYEIITQNVNELYTPIKKQLDGWKNKTKIYAASWRLTYFSSRENIGSK